MEQVLIVRIVGNDDGSLKAVVNSSATDLSRLDSSAAKAGRSIQQNFDTAADSSRSLQAELRAARRDITSLLAIGELQKVTGEYVNFGNIVSAVFAGKVVGSLALYAKETLTTVAATLAQRDAALEAVAATTAHHQALAREYAAAIAATGANSAYVASLREQIVASNAATIAARTQAESTTILSRAMALLGGPVGLITLGATALALWALHAKDARSETESLASANDRLAKSARDARAELAQQNSTVRFISAEIARLERENAQLPVTADTATYRAANQAKIDDLRRRRAALTGETERWAQEQADAAREWLAAHGPKGSTGSGGSPGQTTPEWAAELARLSGESARLTQSVRTDYEVLGDEVANYQQLLAAGVLDQETFNRLIQQSGEKFSGSGEQLKQFNKLMEDLGQRQDANGSAARRWLVDYQLLATYLSGPELEQAVAILDRRFAGEAIEQPAQESADAVAQIYEDTASSIRNSFRDTFRAVFDDGLSGFKDFGDRMLGVFKDMLADMVTLAIARPVVVPIVTGLGGFLGVSGAAQAGVLQQLGVTGGAASNLTGAASILATTGNASLFGTAGAGFSAGLQGGFGAASSLASTTTAATSIGAFAGAALPWIGGALLVDNLTGGGLFGTGWKTKDSGLDLSIEDGDVTGSTYTRQKKKKSLFRGSKTRTRTGEADAALLAGLNDSLDAGIEQILAGAAGLGADTAQAILDSFSISARLSTKGKSQEEAQKAVQDWLDDTLVKMAQAVLQDTRFSGLLIDASKEMVASVLGIGQYLSSNPRADAAELDRVASLSLKEQYDEQRQALIELTTTFDGSLEATQELATATQARYQTELALLRQIAAVRLNVQDTIGGSIEDIRQSTMSPQELYSYLTGQAESLAGQLGAATDPSKIEDLVNRIDALTGQAYNLIPDAAQGGAAQQFIDFLTGVQTSANDQLDSIAQTVQSAHDDLAETIKDSMEKASDQLIAAAQAQKAAAEASAAKLNAAADNLARSARDFTRASYA